MSVFMDLNIGYTKDQSRLQQLIETAAHLGYSTVAINYVFEPTTSKKKQEIPSPKPVSQLLTKLPIVQGRSRPIRVLNRLTIVMSDPSHFRSTSAEYLRFDLLAVQPTTKELFQAACLQYDVDIICIPVTEKLPFMYKRAPVGRALHRGVHFEISYSGSIRDQTVRRYTITNALALMENCKGKSVILSSAAEQPLELRGPYDITNLGLLFGLSEADSKASVSSNCRSAVLLGESRRTANGVVKTMKSCSAASGHQEAPGDECEEAPAAKKSKPGDFISI